MPRIDAKPFADDFDADHVALLCIDMQCGSCLPGGFGEALGNDVSRAAMPATPGQGDAPPDAAR